MTRARPPSLKKLARKYAIKWSLVGLVMILGLGGPAFVLILKYASEKRVETMAQAGAYAFRPQILAGQIREVEPQIAHALKLSNGESVQILDQTMTPIYLDSVSHDKVLCKKSTSTCWERSFSVIERLEPIFFDEDGKDLLGYVDIKMKPLIERGWIIAFFFLIPVIFLLQALGLSYALEGMVEQITERLSDWVRHLKAPRDNSSNKAKLAPFREFDEMEAAISGLNNQIQTLRKEAADEARASAQLAIIREIGHDLKTPLSQLSKYWALFLNTVRTTGRFQDSDAKNINRTLTRMGGVIRNIRAIHGLERIDEIPVISNVVDETQVIVSDLKATLDPQDRITFSNDSSISPILMTRTGYYQILENLVRNAIEALPEIGGSIKINISNDGSTPSLTIKDNGCGFAAELCDKIFDYDFSTKKSKGMGLGLGIVKRICADYGAQITFESKVDHGTVFKIQFQVFKPEELYDEVQNISR